MKLLLNLINSKISFGIVRNDDPFFVRFVKPVYIIQFQIMEIIGSELKSFGISNVCIPKSAVSFGMGNTNYSKTQK